MIYEEYMEHCESKQELNKIEFCADYVDGFDQLDDILVDIFCQILEIQVCLEGLLEDQ
ncbi:MAG TPA: hypothetical protein VMX17_10520 [Candidatus Glassbacteria bacterium]|nr:hypothetical protein [Candidatus Glassbacteria bacterium]